MSTTRITLLTDFGTADGYVAAMKGVIASICPDAAIDDATHAIPQGDVAAAAFALARFWRLYPPGTVHVVVVDPGVGGDRRAIAARADGRLLVAPDNGVLSRVFAAEAPDAIVSLDDPSYHRTPVSATFHGRDIFAPAAAHLARGEPPAALGSPVDDPVGLPWPSPSRGRDDEVIGEVVHVDRFGNLITNLPAAWTRRAREVRVGDVGIGPTRRTYADVERGELVALIGSLGLLEVSVRDGSAAERLGAVRRTPVTAVGAPPVTGGAAASGAGSDTE